MIPYPSLAIRASRLAIRPQPLQGEGWADYLSRLASLNRIAGGVLGISRLLNRTPAQVVVASPALVLSQLGVDWMGDDLLNVPSPTSQRVCVASFGRTLKSRICSICLSGDHVPFVRAEWGMPLTLACELHERLLLDTCQACSRTIDVLRPTLTSCRCGADFRRQTSGGAERWADHLRRAFIEATASQRLDTFARSGVLGQEAARACGWLAAIFKTSNRGRERIYDRDGFLSTKDALLISPLFQEWPKKLTGVLLAQTGLACWGGYDSLVKRLRAKDFSEMRVVIRQVKLLQQPERDPHRMVNRMRSLNSVKINYSIKDVMRVTGHSYGTLVRCIDDGGIPGASYALDEVTGRKTFNFPKSVYRAIELAFLRTDSIEAAAKQVGCSVQAMRGLVRSGCIESKRMSLTGFGRMGDRICPIKANAFVSYLFRIAKKAEGQNVDRVYFSFWVGGVYKASKSKRWRVILEAIKQGKIEIYKSTKSPIELNDLFVLRKQLIKLRPQTTQL